MLKPVEKFVEKGKKNTFNLKLIDKIMNLQIV